MTWTVSAGYIDDGYLSTSTCFLHRFYNGCHGMDVMRHQSLQYVKILHRDALHVIM